MNRFPNIICIFAFTILLLLREVEKTVLRQANEELKNKDKMMKRIFFSLAVVIAGLSQTARAQDVAVKTNLAADAFLSPNIGVEIGLAPRWSMDVSGQFNAWTLSGDRRWKHWFVQPEARFWFCEALGGHFVGLHVMTGQYNAGYLDTGISFLGTDLSKLKTHRYQGWFGGLGAAYGYSWLLGRHWNVEAEIGFGWAYMAFDRFECAGCGRRTGSGHHNYVGPTKAALNLIYVF